MRTHLVLVLLGLFFAPPIAAQGPQTAKQTSLRADQFARLPFLDGPVLSPDGKRVAAKVSIAGEQRLAIVTLATGKPLLVGLNDQELNWWRWVNDEWLIASIGTTENVRGSNFHVHRVASIPADGKRPTKIVRTARIGQYADDVLWTARDGRSKFLLSMKPRRGQAIRASGR